MEVEGLSMFLPFFSVWSLEIILKSVNVYVILIRYNRRWHVCEFNIFTSWTAQVLVASLKNLSPQNPTARIDSVLPPIFTPLNFKSSGLRGLHDVSKSQYMSDLLRKTSVENCIKKSPL
jgi:hypothetical protein